jgi:hypothetical protein
LLRDATGELRVSNEGLELAVTDAHCHVLHPPLPAFALPWIPPRWRRHSVLFSEGLLVDGAHAAACGVMRTSICAGEVPTVGGEAYRGGHARNELVASSRFPLVASPDRDLEVPSPRPVRPEQLRGQRSG